MSDTNFSPHDLPVTTSTLKLTVGSSKENKDLDVDDVLSEHAFWTAPRSGEIVAAAFIPSDGLTANDVNYATLVVRKYDPLSADIATVTTQTVGGGGSDDWSPRIPVPIVVSVAAFGAGDVFTFEITKSGIGVVVPAGVFRITYQVV